MPSIEKTTLPISKVATVVIAVSGFLITVLTQYYTTKSAIQDGFNEVKIEINDLKSEDRIIKKDISEIEKRTDKMEEAAIRYMEAMKPEEPKIKSHGN